MRHFRFPFSVVLMVAAFGTLCTRGAGARSLEQVQQMIRDQGLHWEAAHTSRSDIPWEEFRRTLTFHVPPEYASVPKVNLAHSLYKANAMPSSWDWRANNGVTPVKDQGMCGSCWAFASVGALEASALVNDQMLLDLSEQEVLSCNSAMEGCGGGWFDASYDVFHRLGAVSEDCMPYAGVDGVPCQIAGCPVLVWSDSLIWIDPSVESIKAALLAYGPVASGMAVVDDFQHYHGGCYSSNEGADVNHAVVIVGWDDNACGGAWICKNSWGTNWGSNGFFTITYGSCQIGYGAAVFRAVPQNAVMVSVNALPSTTRDAPVYPLDAQIQLMTASPINPDSVLLNFRVNGGGWNRQAMTLNAGSGLWEGLLPGTPKPATIDYYVTAANMEHRVGRDPHGSSQAVYSFDLARAYEDFEGDHPGWTVGGPNDTATSGIWTCVAPVGTDAQPGTNHTPGGSKCYVTGQGVPNGDLGDNDVDGGQTTLSSPVFDLRGARTAVVKYWRWFSNDRGMNPGSDPWVVQVRNDEGPWVDVERTMDSSDAWIQISADLHQLLGPQLGQVQFRFIATDNDPPSIVEAALDDFEIMSEDRGVSEAPRTLVSAGTPAAAGPNPLAPGMTLRIPYGGSESELRVFDAAGRQVRRIAVASSHGTRLIEWDGRDDAGRTVPAGAYVYLLGKGEQAQQGRVTVIR